MPIVKRFFVRDAKTNRRLWSNGRGSYKTRQDSVHTMPCTLIGDGDLDSNLARVRRKYGKGVILADEHETEVFYL